MFQNRIINSKLVNSTFLHNKEGCLLDFTDDNNAYMIYFVSFLGTLAVLPGNIVSALLMDKIGRLRMLGMSRLHECVINALYNIQRKGSSCEIIHLVIHEPCRLYYTTVFHD